MAIANTHVGKKGKPLRGSTHERETSPSFYTTEYEIITFGLQREHVRVQAGVYIACVLHTSFSSQNRA
jgi:hypothetical protein